MVQPTSRVFRYGTTCVGENRNLQKRKFFPIIYQRVPCKKHGGVRFSINGRDYFELVLISNISAARSIQSVKVKGSKTGWMAMSRNWGANWQSNSYMNGQSMSFMTEITSDGVTKTFYRFCSGELGV